MDIVIPGTFPSRKQNVELHPAQIVIQAALTADLCYKHTWYKQPCLLGAVLLSQMSQGKDVGGNNVNVINVTVG